MIDPEKVAPVPLYHGLGYVKLIDTMGSDERIVESARLSTGKGFLGWGPKEDGEPGDEKLLAYLWNNRHVSPFEMAALTVEYDVPIFVERQFVRHRTMSRNEFSARYSEMPEAWWEPNPDEIRWQGGANKQGSLALSQFAQDEERRELKRKAFKAADLMAASCRASFDVYRMLVIEGVAREQARAVLPVAMMTKVRVGGNLRNWLQLLALRIEPHAQAEAVEVARGIASFVSLLFPRAWALFAADHAFAKGITPAAITELVMAESVDHPRHYNAHASGIECVDIAEHLGFNQGNALKYLWRAGEKDQAKVIEDMRKARWYLARELARKSMPALALPAEVNRMAMKVMVHTTYGNPLCLMASVVRDWDGYGPRKDRMIDTMAAIDRAIEESEAK